MNSSHIQPDPPCNPEIGKLFEEFCATEQGQNLLSNPIRDGDAEAWKIHILRNRMLRSFEAGFDACQYGSNLPQEVKTEVEEILRS